MSPDMHLKLKHWLEKADVGQRELARRLGYDGNGFITLVAGGKRTIPVDDVIKWADALELKDADRARFIDDCIKDVIPVWFREQVADLRKQLLLMRKIAKLNNAFLLWIADVHGDETGAKQIKALMASNDLPDDENAIFLTICGALSQDSRRSRS